MTTNSRRTARKLVIRDAQAGQCAWRLRLLRQILNELVPGLASRETPFLFTGVRRSER